MSRGPTLKYFHLSSRPGTALLMAPRLLAFDLDGTLLRTDKHLSQANREALLDMQKSGAVVALASGRKRSSMMRYAKEIGTDIAMLTLNGAAVYTTSADGVDPVFTRTLPATYASALFERWKDLGVALNFYQGDRLISVRNQRTAPWIELYIRQTGSVYEYIDSYAELEGSCPAKIIFVGEKAELDRQEAYFRREWAGQVYICRTWDFYLEFLNVGATKGTGIAALAGALGIALSDVAAFGDAENDIPMLETVGHPVAMGNADEAVKRASRYVSPYTNDEDAVAREWARLKAL